MVDDIVFLPGRKELLTGMPSGGFQLADELVAYANPFQQLHRSTFLRNIREILQGKLAPSPYSVLIE